MTRLILIPQSIGLHLSLHPSSSSDLILLVLLVETIELESIFLPFLVAKQTNNLLHLIINKKIYVKRLEQKKVKHFEQCKKNEHSSQNRPQKLSKQTGWRRNKHKVYVHRKYFFASHSLLSRAPTLSLFLFPFLNFLFIYLFTFNHNQADLKNQRRIFLRKQSKIVFNIKFLQKKNDFE